MKLSIIIIVIAEFFGSSLWFSANGAAMDLQQHWGVTAVEIGYLTSAVQLGFIVGTLVFAVSGWADRFSASRIFAISAIVGALANFALAFVSEGVSTAIVFRFITGMSLAGIYPVGMKLIVSWEPERKGQALGWLVGMLTLGTALPHLIDSVGGALSWEWVISVTSLLALIAAVMITMMGDGPHHSKSVSAKWGAVFKAFGVSKFRYAVFGYFGHMWELYAFWTITPFLVANALADINLDESPIIALMSFLVIGVGAMGCIVGGYVSLRKGSALVASVALFASGAMCFLYPLLGALNGWLGLAMLLFWGVMVVADSPQFSALAASFCPQESIGSALAIMNSIGFFITILTIELVTMQWSQWQNLVGLILLPGPIFGLFYMYQLLRQK